MIQQDPAARPDFVLLGASHLSRLVGHLDGNDWLEDDIAKFGWCITDEHVNAAASEISAAMAESEPGNSSCRPACLCQQCLHVH